MYFCMTVLAQTSAFIQFCKEFFRRGRVLADVLYLQSRVYVMKIQSCNTFDRSAEETSSSQIINSNLFKICMHGSDYITKPMQLVKGNIL